MSDNAVTTWRYLRLAMVLLVAGLFVSIAYERLRVKPDCWQTSISSYYYTPVHGFLIGTLVAMGVCLICLRGSTDLEDVLLNLAGILAPFVAFVPTPDRSGCSHLVVTQEDRLLSIANNVWTLLAVALVALIAAAAFLRNADWPARAGYGVAAVLWIVAALVFGLWRDWFNGNAHDIAATTMFVFFLGVVAINVLDRHRYAVVGAAMLLCVVLIPAIGGKYWILVLEAALILLFAVFWVIQTAELWGDGLRTGQKAGSSAGSAALARWRKAVT